MSKFMYVSECGDGVVVEAAVEGPKKAAAHVVGAARGDRAVASTPAAPSRPTSVAPPLSTYSSVPTTSGKHRIE